MYFVFLTGEFSSRLYVVECEFYISFSYINRKLSHYERDAACENHRSLLFVTYLIFGSADGIL